MEKKITFLLIIFLSFSYVNGANSLQDKDRLLSVYPNPANQLVNVKLFAEHRQSPRIEILDLTGKMVLKFKEEVSRDEDIFKASLDVSSLRPGIYFVKVIQGEKTFSEKLVVK